MTTLKELQQDVAAGKYGDGYIGLVDGTPTFIPMPDGRFHVEYNPTTGEAKGRYYTVEENAQRDAEEAAYEIRKLAKIQAVEAKLAAETAISTIKQIVAVIPTGVIKRYPGIVGDVGKYLDEGNLAGAAQLLALFVADMQAANDIEALEAAAPVITLFGGK